MSGNVHIQNASVNYLIDLFGQNLPCKMIVQVVFFDVVQELSLFDQFIAHLNARIHK